MVSSTEIKALGRENGPAFANARPYPIASGASARSDFSVRPNRSSLGCVPEALDSEPTATGLSWALTPEWARPVSALPCGLPG
jgi:hypothetical protein